jgi:hypothetical protein
MSEEKQEWILAGDNGLSQMYLGKLSPGKRADYYLSKLSQEGGLPVAVELFEVRLILHLTIPVNGPRGDIVLQTVFKVMPFPTNPDGGHLVVKATTLIDVEGDAPTKEMLMGQLRECAELERMEKANRSKVALGPSALIRA